MAKVVRDENNRFRTAWEYTREQGVSRKVMADSLGIDRGRLNDLILGRAKPTLGEQSAVTGRRRASLVTYGGTSRTGRRFSRSFYTGRGKSYEDLLDQLDFESIVTDHLDESPPPGGWAVNPDIHVELIEDRAPSGAAKHIWAMRGHWRDR